MANSTQAILYRGKWHSLPQADALAVGQINRKNFNEALEVCDLVLRKAPGHARAHIHRAISLQKMGQASEALAALDRAIALSPKSTEAFVNKAAILASLRRFPESIAEYQKAIELDPRHANAHFGCGNAMVISGDMAGAEKMLRRALELDPLHVPAALKLSDIQKFSDPSARDVRRLAGYLERPDLSAWNRTHIHFALGKIFDDCGQYDQAFAYYEQANKSFAAQFPYDADASARLTDAIIRIFSREFLAEPFPFASADASPIFVVGMNRSGTTLIATILSNHPDIASAGELGAMNEFTQRLASLTGTAYPDGALKLTPGIGSDLTAEYLQRLRQAASPTARYVVDKLPLNYLHLGFIAKLFPNAHVIHCVRDPLDTGLSNFFQRFSSVCSFSYDLKSFGHYFLEYQKLMRHWQSVLPLPFLEVKYEDMVARTDQVAREALDFLTLDWNDRCLTPHLNDGPVETASFWQIRQPIYTHAIGRWRHYEKHLGPLMETIQHPA